MCGSRKGRCALGRGFVSRVKGNLGLGRTIDRGKDIPVGRADLVQEEIEELGKLGSRPDHSEKSNGPKGPDVVADIIIF